MTSGAVQRGYSQGVHLKGKGEEISPHIFLILSPFPAMIFPNAIMQCCIVENSPKGVGLQGNLCIAFAADQDSFAIELCYLCITLYDYSLLMLHI